MTLNFVKVQAAIKNLKKHALLWKRVHLVYTDLNLGEVWRKLLAIVRKVVKAYVMVG